MPLLSRIGPDILRVNKHLLFQWQDSWKVPRKGIYLEWYTENIVTIIVI